MKSDYELKIAIDKYADTVKRICFIHLKNYSDVEDIFQEVFLKYIFYKKSFESDEHEKAWIIRITINSCKDLLKSFFRKKVYSLEELNYEPSYLLKNERELVEAVFKLPDKYRDVIYLYYYEGYSAVEIARALGKSENTIYTWLARAKNRLKAILGGEIFDESV